MLIYLAHPVAPGKDQTVSEQIKDKGLNFIRAKPCDVHVTVIVKAVQPAYACYVKNIPAFIEATMKQEIVQIGTRGYPITTPSTVMPWRAPRTIYHFANAPTDTVKQEISRYSSMVRTDSKIPAYVIDEPTVEQISRIVALGACKTTRHLHGVVNIDAVRYVILINRLFSGFIYTHAYPAFYYDQDTHVNKKVGFATSMKRRKVDNDSYVACISAAKEKIEGSIELGAKEGDKAPTGSDPKDILLTYAKPTIEPGRKLWGPIEEIPNADGIFIPFVAELSVPDKFTVVEVISTYFVQCLASDIHGMATMLNNIRSAWGLICTTTLGHEITHIAKCIHIAIQAQAIVYPIYTQTVYEGTVISGANYNLCINGEVFGPTAYAKFQGMVSKSSMHAQALQRISRVCNDGANEIYTCTTMRQLASIVQKEALNELDRQEVISAAKELNFRSTYWSSSIPNVKTAMNLLVNGDVAIVDDIPLHPNYLFSTNRVETVMAAFGHQAFTFLIPNGREIKVQAGDPPKNFHIRIVPIEIAIQDMNYVMENGIITNNVMNLSSKHRDIALKGKDKTTIWEDLFCIVPDDTEERATSMNTAQAPQQGNVLDDLSF